MARIAALILSLLLAAPSVWAAPVISGTSGTPTHGSAITVSGAGFGTKAVAAPSLFDKLDGSFNAAWATSHDLAIGTANQRHSNSTHNAHLNFRAGLDNGSLEAGSTTAPKWFVSYWVYLDTNWSWGTTDFSGSNKFLSNIKFNRFYNPSGAARENYVVAYNGWENQLVADLEDLALTYDRTSFFASFRASCTLGSWHHIQMAFREATGLGVTDGLAQWWFDGSSQGSLLTRTRIVEDADKRPFIVGWFNSWSPSDGAIPDASDDEPNDYYIDDAFIDVAWSRVEIGNASTYSACTHREMQGPTAWSDGSVSFPLNLGSFTANENKYVFVVDSAGTASTGWLLTAAAAKGSSAAAGTTHP